MNRASSNVMVRNRLVVGACVLLVATLAWPLAANALPLLDDEGWFCQQTRMEDPNKVCVVDPTNISEQCTVPDDPPVECALQVFAEPVYDLVEECHGEIVQCGVREIEPTLDWVEGCIQDPEDPVIDCLKEELSPILPDWLDQCLESTVTECADNNVPSLVTATGDFVDWVINESPEWSTTSAQWALDPDSHTQPQATSDCSWHDPRGAGWYPPNGNCKYAQANNVVTCSTNCRSAELHAIQWRGGTASGECYPDNDVPSWGLYSAQVIRASDNAVLWEHPEFHGWFENCDVYDGTDNHVIKMTLHSDTIVKYRWYHGWFSEVELFISVRGPGGGGGSGGGGGGGGCGLLAWNSLDSSDAKEWLNVNWNSSNAGGSLKMVMCL